MTRYGIAVQCPHGPSEGQQNTPPNPTPMKIRTRKETTPHYLARCYRRPDAAPGTCDGLERRRALADGRTQYAVVDVAPFADRLSYSTVSRSDAARILRRWRAA